MDVTDRHVFVGYKPVIIAFAQSDIVDSQEPPQNIELEFRHQKKVIGSLLLQKEHVVKIGEVPTIFYRATKGVHTFINPFHKLINQVRQRLASRKPGNVTLNGNLYDQVRIAYCIPRVIGVITVGASDRMNMFPTDLHGSVSNGYYVSSLRIGGSATHQVEQAGKIALSKMDTLTFRDVYSLGPNHMRELRPSTVFQCSGESLHFHIPLPQRAVSCLELERVSSIDIGIHRIHIYKIFSDQVLLQDKSTLAHIHGYYAQWRLNRNIPTHMMIR